MKKLAFLSLFVCAIALGINFSGHQSIVNLGVHQLFTAPASTSYFVNGQLTLPRGDAGQSQAVVQMYKNGVSAIYTGASGATGFSVPAFPLSTGDVIAVGITSNATVDQGLNKVKGDVFFGNAF